MKQLKKLALTLVIAGVSLGASAERVTVYTVPNYVKHYYEFGSDNPTGYWWCGHTALKIVDAFVNNRGAYPTSLQSIHTAFRTYNASGDYNATKTAACATGWCAYLEDVVYSAKNLYGMPNAKITKVSKLVNSKPNYVGLFNTIRTGIKTNKSPLIAFGDLSTDPNRLSGVGHAWVVVGYNTDGVASPDTDPRSVWLFLRDNNLSKPAYDEMDRWVTIETFYKMLANNTTSSVVKVASFK